MALSHDWTSFFQFNNIVWGIFPHELIRLNESLAVLDLGGNDITAAVNHGEALGFLTKLVDLRYDQTNFFTINDGVSFGIPTEIGHLTLLEFYDINSCLYQGPVSGESFPSTMTALGMFVAVWRRLVSNVCSGLFCSSSFVFFLAEYIDHRFVFLTGQLPTELGSLPAFRFYYATNNVLSGNIDFLGISSSLGKCHILK